MGQTLLLFFKREGERSGATNRTRQRGGRRQVYPGAQQHTCDGAMALLARKVQRRSIGRGTAQPPRYVVHLQPTGSDITNGIRRL